MAVVENLINVYEIAGCINVYSEVCDWKCSRLKHVVSSQDFSLYIFPFPFIIDVYLFYNFKLITILYAADLIISFLKLTLIL